jgi:autotransporter-associated beta strand protein
LSAVALASFAAVVLTASLPVRADDYWSTAAGDWSNPANWGGTLPTTSDNAWIVNGGTAAITQPGATCGTLSLGNGAGSGTVQLTGGDLYSFSQNVGYSGTGTFTQCGGTNTSGSLLLGGLAGGSGTYNLNGGLFVLSSLTQGPGTAAFNFNGGTLQAGFIFSSSVPMTLGGSGATFDTADQSVTLSGNLSGSGGLNKAGNGVLSLSGTNTYGGPTIVTAGTLQLSGTMLSAGTPLPAGTKIMPVGDSITYGNGGTNAGYRGFLYNDLTASGNTFQFVGTTNGNPGSLPTSPVDQTYHDGWPGWTTGDVLGTFQDVSNNGTSGNISTWLTQLAGSGQSPTIITMMIGTNDSSRGGWSVATGTANTAAIINTAFNLDPGVRFLLAECTPRYDSSAAWVNAYNAGLVNLVAQDQAAGDNIGLVDLNTNFPSNGLTSDQLHPNDIGYAWMATQWSNAILGTGIIASNTALPLNSPTTVAGGATLDLNGSLASLGPLNGAGSITLGNSGGLTVNSTAGNDSTFSGSISGTGSFTKTGPATLLLSGSNSYNGPTTINQGKLVVDGWLTNSAVTVNSGGTLSGTGSLTSVTVNAGGTLAPGDSQGVLDLSGNLNLASGAVLDYDLDGVATGDEVLMPSGQLILSEQQFGNFNFTTRGGFGEGTYMLIDAGSISGSLGNDLSGTIDGLPATLVVQGNDLELNVTPEPSTLTLLGAGVLGLIGCGWHRLTRSQRRR